MRAASTSARTAFATWTGSPAAVSTGPPPSCAANRVWYIDLFRASVVVFDGRSIAASPVPFPLHPADDVGFAASLPRSFRQVPIWSD
ncbi:hypothetical protein ABZ912_23565 [Nonomuraea angiospora]|uniref:hypothetical protein n=1 Tax=Nonomuraea angiospora TaxID=46172 RepID=UPI0033D65719